MKEEIQDIWKLEYPLNLTGLSGNVNRSFFCRNNNVVIKQYNSRFSKQNIINSLTAQDSLSSLGIAAEVLYTNNGDICYSSDTGTFYSVSKYIHGQTLNEDEIKKDFERFNKFGLWLAKCHKSLASIASSLTEENNLISIYSIEEAYVNFEQAQRQNKSELLDRQVELFHLFVCKNSFSLPSYKNDVIHGDMRLNNIIRRSLNGKLALIDFDQVSFMSRTYEIMRFFLELEDLDDVQTFVNHLKIFLAAYESVYPIQNKDRPYVVNLYFYNLLTNIRCFKKEFFVRNNTFFVQSRLKKIEWLSKNIDRINSELAVCF